MPGYSISLIRILNWKIHFLVWVGVYVCVCVCVSAAVCTNCLCLCESLWKHAHESSSCYVEKDTYEFEINSILPHKIPRTCAPTLSHAHTHTHTCTHRCMCKPHVHTHAEESSRLMPVVANVDMFAPSLAPRTRRRAAGIIIMPAQLLLLLSLWLRSYVKQNCRNRNRSRSGNRNRNRESRERRKRQRHRTITRGKTKRYVKGERAWMRDKRQPLNQINHKVNTIYCF